MARMKTTPGMIHSNAPADAGPESYGIFFNARKMDLPSSGTTLGMFFGIFYCPGLGGNRMASSF
jgi:hypothetical protein